MPEQKDPSGLEDGWLPGPARRHTRQALTKAMNHVRPKAAGRLEHHSMKVLMLIRASTKK